MAAVQEADRAALPPLTDMSPQDHFLYLENTRDADSTAALEPRSGKAGGYRGACHPVRRNRVISAKVLIQNANTGHQTHEGHSVLIQCLPLERHQHRPLGS